MRPILQLLALSLVLAAAPAASAVEEPVEAEHEAGGHGHGGELSLFEGGGSVVPFAAMLANFVVLALLIGFFARKPLSAFLVARHRAIQDGLDEARTLREKAESKSREYGDRLAAFQDEIARLLDDFRKAGEAERARILGEAGEKAARLRREAEFLVTQEAKQVRIDLHREYVAKAVVAAEQRLEAAVTPADQVRLADDYLAQIGETAGGGRPPGGQEIKRP